MFFFLLSELSPYHLIDIFFLLFNNFCDSDWISVWGDCILNAFGGLVVVQVDIIQATLVLIISYILS